MTDDERLCTCQKEIQRLRAVIQEYRQTLETALHINYDSLFETWTDFDDAESPDEVVRLIDASGMGPIDAVSFAAFCYGYEQLCGEIRRTTMEIKETDDAKYTTKGCKDREYYLYSLADDRGIDIMAVRMIVDMLGPSENFDGLVSELEDFDYMGLFDGLQSGEADDGGIRR
jgi:hypothetical protein